MFLLKDFRGKKRIKFIICFFFFKVRRKDCLGEEWIFCKEMESEDFNVIVYIR